MKSKYLRLIRPVAWLVFLYPFFVGFGLGATNDTNPYHVLFAIIAFLSTMIFSFTLNCLSDKDVDKYHDGRSKDMNLSKQSIVTGELSERIALGIALISVSLSLLFAWLVNYLFFTVFVIGNLIGYLYSMPPTRFKTKPVTDILCNALAVEVVLIAGLSIGGANMNLLFIIGCFFVASTFYIPTVVTDYDFDIKAGLTTSAVFFGPKNIIRALYPLTVVILAIFTVVVFTATIELQITSILIMLYTVIFVLASNIKLKDERLKAHQNWIFVPFFVFSVGYFLYGLLKMAELIAIF